ncbi:MAG: hypothetical protein WCE21_05125 [Candidatus Babeliales bacterium]
MKKLCHFFIFLACAWAHTVHSDVMIINNTAITIEARLHNPSYRRLRGESGPIAPSQAGEIAIMSGMHAYLEIKQSGSQYEWQPSLYIDLDHAYAITQHPDGKFQITQQ